MQGQINQLAAESLGIDSPVLHRVYSWKVSFSKRAAKSVCSAVGKLADKLMVEPSDVVTHLFNEMYWIEESDKLLLVVRIPGVGAEVYLQVAEGEWAFRQDSDMAH